MVVCALIFKLVSFCERRAYLPGLVGNDRTCFGDLICINIFAFEPNLHISQMTSHACEMLDGIINMHN